MWNANNFIQDLNWDSQVYFYNNHQDATSTSKSKENKVWFLASKFNLKHFVLNLPWKTL